MATVAPATPSTSTKRDWTKPQAMAIPKEGYFQLQNGRYGAVYPRTPACHGFTIIARIKPGREDAIRAYGKTIEKAIADLTCEVSAPTSAAATRYCLYASFMTVSRSL